MEVINKMQIDDVTQHITDYYISNQICKKVYDGSKQLFREFYTQWNYLNSETYDGIPESMGVTVDGGFWVKLDQPNRIDTVEFYETPIGCGMELTTFQKSSGIVRKLDTEALEEYFYKNGGWNR